ncbi:hypothetical protein ACEPPN_010698 [Leptodophora sp. 'Broadleaf-Isolate-01']
MPITDEENIEDLSTRLSRLKLWTPEPLKQFHPFPCLPKELRRLIFKLALPSSERMITVTAHYRELMPKKMPDVFFTATPPDPGLPPQLEDVRDVRLLTVCFESREVFLEDNRAYIPGSSKSLIRFNQQQSTIFITNYHYLVANESLKHEYKSGLWKPTWPVSIQNLALGDRPNQELHLSTSETDIEKHLPYLKAFTGLKRLWIGAFLRQSLAPFLDSRISQNWIVWRKVINEVELAMDCWVAGFGSCYMIPSPQPMAYGPRVVGFGLHP